MAEPSIMISAQELQQRLHGPEPPVVLDCSWFLPNVTQTGAGEYAQKHIPGARFWDLNGIADKTNKAPHMLPTPAGFAQAMGGLGISRNVGVARGLSSPSRAPLSCTTVRAYSRRPVCFGRSRCLDTPT